MEWEYTGGGIEGMVGLGETSIPKPTVPVLQVMVCCEGCTEVAGDVV